MALVGGCRIPVRMFLGGLKGRRALLRPAAVGVVLVPEFQAEEKEMSTIEGDDVARPEVPEAPAVCATCNELMAGDARFCAFCGSARVLEEAPQLDEVERTETLVDGPAEAADHKRFRWWKVVVPLAVVVVAAIAAAVLLLPSDEPAYDLETAMTTLVAESTDVWDQADRASTLAQLTAAGEAAAEASGALSELRTELVEVGNVDDRRAAEAAFAAHIGSLEALGGLAGLKAEEVGDWPDVAAAIGETVEDLSSAEPLLVERELPGAPDHAADVEATGERIGVSMASIAEKLDGWAAEVERINADKLAQKVALDEYVGAFRAQTERYAGLRSSLSDLTQRLLNENGMFSTVYADFGAALAQRREVHAAMSALVPPAPLVPAHTAIVSAVQDSTGAVQSAITGIEEYQWDYYYTIDSTPGWQAFQRSSEAVGNAYNGGVGAWDAAVAAEEARIAGIKTPAQPAV